jgi:Tfp pilus assembly protein PilE
MTADETVMGRAVGIVSLLLGTLVIGLMIASQSSHSSDRKSASAEINRAAQTAAEVKLQQAAFAVEQFHALNGTYAASSLGGLGVRLARADAASYCLESGSGATIAHLAGPGGTPAPGACQ